MVAGRPQKTYDQCRVIWEGLDQTDPGMKAYVEDMKRNHDADVAEKVASWEDYYSRRKAQKEAEGKKGSKNKGENDEVMIEGGELKDDGDNEKDEDEGGAAISQPLALRYAYALKVLKYTTNVFTVNATKCLRVLAVWCSAGVAGSRREPMCAAAAAAFSGPPYCACQ